MTEKQTTAAKDTRSVTEGSVSCQLETSFCGLDVLRSEWDNFVLAQRGDIYMTYDWCRVWWEHYGLGRSLRLFIFRQDGAIVGILPMLISDARLGPFRCRVAKLIGSEYTLNLCHPPVRLEAAPQVLQQALDHLTQEDRCDGVLLGPILAEDGLAECLRSLARQTDRVTLAFEASCGPLGVFHLPETKDAYLASLGSRQRNEIKRHEKRLTKDFTIAFEVVTEPARALAEFDAFCEMHQEQWRRIGKPGHFGAWPKAKEFHEAMVQAQAQDGRLRIIRMLANDKAIAYEYSYVFGDCYYGLLTARDSDPAWRKYGVGITLYVKTLEIALKEGVRRLDAGREHYDYKTRLGGREIPTTRILLVSTRPGARRRCRLFRLVSELYHLLYYKIWIRRIVPRLRLRPRTLSSTWIQSRL